MKKNPPMLITRQEYMEKLCLAVIHSNPAFAKEAIPEIYKLIFSFADAKYFVFYSAMVGNGDRYLSKAFIDKNEANEFFEKLKES